MGEAIGYRLGNELAHELIWLFNESAADVSGLAGINYRDGGSASTVPERLLLQEALADFRGGDATREARLILAARRMSTEERRGPDYWWWIRLAYGPQRRLDPHDEFGRELAPLVALTDATRKRAERRWPRWHMELHAERYSALYRDVQAKLGRTSAAIERMGALIPGEPPAGEWAAVVDDVVDKAVRRVALCRKMNQHPGREGAYVEEARTEGDRMFSAACRAFDAAVAHVDGGEERESRAEVRVDREARRGAATIDDRIAACARMIAEWPAGMRVVEA